MKTLLSFALLILVGCTSIPERAVASQSSDYLVRAGIQGLVANSPAVKTFVASLGYKHCSIPTEVAGASQMCTMMAFGNSCNFTFTFDCEVQRAGSENINKESVSGAGQYNESTKKVQIFELLLPWREGGDWIQHLSN